MTQIRVGMVGLGTQAQNHLSVLSRDKRVTLAGVADIIEPVAQSTAKRYGCNSYGTYQELMDTEKLDAVYVVSPNVFHYETLKYALGRNLNVFCEKPMVIKLEHARDIVNSVKSAGVVFQVGHNRHFAFVYKKVKELVASGKIKPYMAIMKMVTGELQRPAWGANPKISGGHLYDTTLHMLDMCRWLFGEVKEVSCRAEANVYPQILNDFWINLTHESGLQVPIFTSGHASWIVPFERIEIIGDHAANHRGDEQSKLHVRAGSADPSRGIPLPATNLELGRGRGRQTIRRFNHRKERPTHHRSGRLQGG